MTIDALLWDGDPERVDFEAERGANSVFLTPRPEKCLLIISRNPLQNGTNKGDAI